MCVGHLVADVVAIGTPILFLVRLIGRDRHVYKY